MTDEDRDPAYHYDKFGNECTEDYAEEERREDAVSWRELRTLLRQKPEMPPHMKRYELAVKLPHFVAVAMTAEEMGRSSGSKKLRGIGVPLPFTDHDGTATVARLWAMWWKQRGGAADFRGFDVRIGRERNGERVAELWSPGSGCGGALCASGWINSKHPHGARSIYRHDELQRRLIEAEGLAMHDDPLVVIARNAVAVGGSSFCACCGRTLTDPVSVETGIGPECGAEFHERFNRIWRAERAMNFRAAS